MPDLSKHSRSTNGSGIANAGDITGNGNAGDVSGIGNGLDNANASGAAPAPIDAFSDLSKLQLDQAYADTVGVKKVLMVVPVRKPNSQEWVRVHPEYRLPGAPIIELKDDRESFLVTPAVATQLSPGD